MSHLDSDPVSARMLAHSNPAHPEDIKLWEPLCDEAHRHNGHLENVTRLCATYAAATFHFLDNGAGTWEALGRLTGCWHDLGKFSEDFQSYLRRAASTGDDAHTSEMRGKVDHTSAGAQHAVATLPPGIGALLAYPIAGHHAGLLDGIASGACMKARLSKGIPEWQARCPMALLQPLSSMLANATAGPPPLGLPPDPFAMAFATRMLFSCLVDADFLATEGFMDSQRSMQRPNTSVDFRTLDAHLQDYIKERFAGAQGAVAEARAEVLSACLEAAEGSPGCYSLTVPTGGGKTLSSLAFALRHAAHNGSRRVIYAIPFTSIIEQNADVFREVFADSGADLDTLILEHHSNSDPDQETMRSRLASENWDAPLIVTTNVQLFESLFANRTSRCRKLHRIAGSVIILDEVQTLPVTLLEPCLKVLRLLEEQYGCTVVLCTATQPAIEYRDDFKIGLPEAIPIIADAPALYRRLKRVQVRQAGTLNCATLAVRLAGAEQGLAIVNTRRHAADLYQALVERVGPEAGFHLSAAMTPAHRSQQLAAIRHKLKGGQRCHVVSTQLIEAGVDIDFPVVWRALAGLDSIAQAAGRCNREGRWDEAITWVFRPDETEHPIPRGYLRRSADAAAQVIATGRYDDLLGLDAIEHYFRLHYWQHSDQWDREHIMGEFVFDRHDRALPFRFNYASTAGKFRFIEDGQRSIIVPYDDIALEWVEQLRWLERSGKRPCRALTRRLQRYSVSVAEYLWRTALGKGQIEVLLDRYAILTAPQLYYSDELGLQLDADPLYDPNETIV